jgi:hypothetical protein
VILFLPDSVTQGLDEDFRQILEYFGQDFAQPKMKQSATMMEYQNGFNFPLSIPLQPFNFPQQNEAPNLPSKTFW